MVCTINAGKMSIWMNGKLIAEQQVADTGKLQLSEAVKIILGQRSENKAPDIGDQRYFNGDIDEFAIFNHVLTEQEINQQFNAGQTIFLK